MDNRIDHSKTATALSVALRILEKWEATPVQVQNILNLSDQALATHHLDSEATELSDDQATRVSYLLNIHEALRVVFDNPANVYGFMRLANHGPYFDGASPLSVIAGGDLDSLHVTYRRVAALQQPW